MAYPYPIPDRRIGGNPPESTSWGPWVWNDVLLCFLNEYDNQPGQDEDWRVTAWVSFDDGVSWTEAEGGNRPLSPVGHSNADRRDKILYVTVSDSAAGPPTWRMRIEQFDFSLLTWGTPITGGPAAIAINNAFGVYKDGGTRAFIRVRDDRHLILITTNDAGGGSVGGMLSVYDVPGAAWDSIDGSTGSSGSVEELPIALLAGAERRMHYFYITDSAELYHQAVLSDDTLAAAAKIADLHDPGAGWNMDGWAGIPAYNQSGEIAIPFVEDVGSPPVTTLSVARAICADAPSWTIENITSSNLPYPGAAGWTGSQTLIAAYIGRYLYAFWSDENWDLWYAKSVPAGTSPETYTWTQPAKMLSNVRGNLSVWDSKQPGEIGISYFNNNSSPAVHHYFHMAVLAGLLDVGSLRVAY
jgi:hypothetical protein